jgi:hypothetical protein
MTIDDIVARFAALPGALVGSGPRHPSEPDPSIEGRVAGFFTGYPALRRDQGYVDFIWRYAGASRTNPEGTDLFDVFGFSNVTADILDDFDESPVDEDGYLYFAQAVRHEGRNTYTYGFAFNVDPDREWAVYRVAAMTDAARQPYLPYTDSFTSFLAEAVANGGRYPRPSIG